MALVQGVWNKLLHPGLKVAFLKALEEDDPIEYSDLPIGQPKILHKTFALGFTVTEEMLNDAFDDLAKKKAGINDFLTGRPPLRELHVYDLGDGMLVPCQLVDDLFV